jgi:leucyl aminopeptidase (aminopeptidase T)
MMRRISASVDAGLAVVAHRLVEGSLSVVPGERVLVVHDRGHQELANVILEAIIVARGDPQRFCLEDLGPRPHATLHPSVAGAISRAQASLLLIDFHDGEHAMRKGMADLAIKERVRHGHMVGVGRASMAGFSVDPHRIAEKARALTARLRPDARITVRSAAGSDLVITLTPRCRWVEYGCIVGTGKRVNLPGGELCTSPDAVTGVYVADGTLGDADGVLKRRLEQSPITLRISASRVQAVECSRDPGLARAVSERIFRTANLDRVGLAGFGINLGLTAPVGDVFTDQKVPGVHLSLGETFPEQTGATWTSKSWIALTTGECDADIDKIPVIRRGRYLI